MLGTLRKFSSTILAKVLLFIIAIPFVFWGMGDLFSSGNQNTIVKIGDAKIQTKEFINFIKYNAPNTNNGILDKKIIEKLLSNFIGEKLIALEVKSLDITLSDKSLSKIIKNEKLFMKENKFSRTEYEKFLIKNNLSATSFESNISNRAKKDQLLKFISGGIVPPFFLVNAQFNTINQKRYVQVINLNDIFDKKLNFSQNIIKNYYEKNKNNFKKSFKKIKFIKLDPNNLSDGVEYNELFFQKIDEIDDMVIEGQSLSFIKEKYNLNLTKDITLDEVGKNLDSSETNNFLDELAKQTSNMNEINLTKLIEFKNDFYLIEIAEINTKQINIDNADVRKEIVKKLKNIEKRKLMSNLINKINQNNFKKNDFDKFSNDENVKIQEIKIESQNDNKIFKKDLIHQIYMFSDKKVVLVADIGLTENFLIYIDKIENVNIDKNTKDYENYYNLSKVVLTGNIYDTYDSYLGSKYKININNKALDSVLNYFR